MASCPPPTSSPEGMKPSLRASAFLVALAFAWVGPALAGDTPFSDMTGNPLYDPWIGHFAEQGFVEGYKANGKATGLFGPHDEILRSEIAKVSVAVRLAEGMGIERKWFALDAQRLAEEVLQAIRPWRNCGEGNAHCANIGGQPFPDVAPKPTDCERQPGEHPCDPWYGEFVYYAVDRGYIQGHQEPSGPLFRPGWGAIRIHALKLVMADNGHFDPAQDLRFQRLLALAEEKNLHMPACLASATGQMLEKGNDPKLVAYALLADQLQLFGPNCEVFTQAGKLTPQQRADFMQLNITRKEMLRYFGMTSTYAPLYDLSFVPQSGTPPAQEEWMEKALEELLEENQNAFVSQWLEDAEALKEEGEDPADPLAEEGLPKAEEPKLPEAPEKPQAEDDSLLEDIQPMATKTPAAPSPAMDALDQWLLANGLADSNASALEAWDKAKGSEAISQKALNLLDESGRLFSVPARTPLKIVEQNESYALVWPQGYLRPYRAGCSQMAGLCAGSLLAMGAVSDVGLGPAPQQSKTLSPKELLESGIAVYAAKPIYLCKSEYDCFAIPQGTKMLSAGGTIKSRTSSDGKTSLWQPVTYQGQRRYALVREVLYKTDDQPLLDALYNDLKENLDWHVTRNAEIIRSLDAYLLTHYLNPTLSHGLTSEVIGKWAQYPESFEYGWVKKWFEEKKPKIKAGIFGNLDKELAKQERTLKAIRDWGRGSKPTDSLEYGWVEEWYEENKDYSVSSGAGWIPEDPDNVTVRYWKDLTIGEQKALHYHRNAYQDDLPLTEAEAIESGDWEYKGEAVAHNLAGARGNKDYRGIGEKAGQQAVYNVDGKLVLTPENGGTYDFVPPAEDVLLHTQVDVKPWVEWGNSPNDATFMQDRINSLSQTVTGRAALVYISYLNSQEQ